MNALAVLAAFSATALTDVLAALWQRALAARSPAGASSVGVLLYGVQTAEALLVVRDSPWLAIPGALGVAVGSALGACARARKYPSTTAIASSTGTS